MKKMILTAHQPGYLPWLALFHKIASSEYFMLFDKVQYVPRTYMNRNIIKSSTGVTILTVPVLSKGYMEKSISEIEINNELDWQKKHWKTIFLNYKKARFFKEYADYFESIYTTEWKYLADLNFYILQWILGELNINTKVDRARNFCFEGKNSDLVLDMCVKMKASKYIFGSHGKNYADIESFNKYGITPLFQKYTYPVYRQLHGPFLSELSIIDLLFNEGHNALEILMKHGEIHE